MGSKANSSFCCNSQKLDFESLSRKPLALQILVTANTYHCKPLALQTPSTINPHHRNTLPPQTLPSRLLFVSANPIIDKFSFSRSD